LNLKIGYSTTSPNVLDPKSISDYYKTLKLSNSRFQNLLEYNVFRHNKSWNDLVKPADPNRWTVSMASTDGGYDATHNEIAYPAGFMQLPGFSVGLPEYVTYSGFGSSAGSDVFHGIDRNGSKYDVAGIPTTGWDATTLANFEKKTNCFVDQYNKFTLPGTGNEVLRVNGTLTRDENVADASGLTAAFAAWQKRNKATPNAGLPGLEKYTADQLFFLSFASSSCGKRRPADQAKGIKTEKNSPSRFRINGALENSADFKTAFNCPVKKPTCEVW
jgi:endothelin-converting enzyme